MNAFQFFLTPYSLVSVPVFIVGLVCTLYLLRVGRKTTATRFLIGALGCLPLAMAALFINASWVRWGGAFSLAPDMFAVFSMTALIQFVYRLPAARPALEMRLVGLFSGGLCLAALAFALGHFGQILFAWPSQPFFDFPSIWLMPCAFLAALAAAVRQTVQAHRQAAAPTGGWGATVVQAFVRPQGPTARILRNYTLALLPGIAQGLAIPLNAMQLLTSPWDLYLMSTSMLVMVVVIVYATVDYAAPYTSLSLKLMGLSLAVTLAILSFVGLRDFQANARQARRERELQIEVVRRSLADPSAALSAALPAAVIYLMDWSTPPYRLLYARPASLDFTALLAEERSRQAGGAPPPPLWNEYAANILLEPGPAEIVVFRYAGNPPGSLYRYAGYRFTANGSDYEVGFSLEALARPGHRVMQQMILIILASGALIIVIFPLLFRAILTRPLSRLLAGVRQADAGQLDVVVPVTEQDEIGFLTQAFNKMTASLQAEMAERRRAEAEIKTFNATLERQVRDRTHDLSVLYAISAIANRASGPEAMLTESLQQVIATLQAEAGVIHVTAPALRLCQATPAFPAQALQPLRDWLAEPEVVAWVSAQPTAQLLPDLATEPRAPQALRQGYPLTLLLTPVQAHGETLGLLGLARPVRQAFSVEEVALLASIADQLGLALRNDRLRQQAIVLEERARLARDLHDSVTQSLYGLVTLAEAGQAQLEQAGAAGVPLTRTLDRLGDAARQTLKEMRLYIHQLRPSVLEDEGLVGALALRLAAVEGRSNLQTRLLADEGLPLPPATAQTLYLIATEALNNALRHAQATRITVRLEGLGDQVRLEVSDDGRGFDPAVADRRGLGLASLRERARQAGGQLEISSAPGAGAQVRVTLPWRAESPNP